MNQLPAEPKQKHARYKLQEADVLEMRERSAKGVSKAQLAREFGISKPHAVNICNRKSWKHI